MDRLAGTLLVGGALAVSGCNVAALVHRPGASRAPSATPGAPQAADATVGGPEASATNPAPPRLPDDGITSELHRAYQGQIVFSTTEIPKDGADEQTLASEFYADELIYGRAFLPHSIENEPVIDDHGALVRTQTRGYIVKVFVDGREVKDRLESKAVSNERRAATTLQVWPHPAASDEPTSRTWVQSINTLAPGDHEIRLELWAQDRWRTSRAALATGTLTLHKTAGQGVSAGRTFADLDRGMTDAALSTEMLGNARYFAKKQGWKESMAEVAIRSKDWIEVRHPQLHHVIARRLQTWVRADWPDGHCTAQEMLFEQKVKKGRPDGPLYVGSSGDQVLLDCSAKAVAKSDPWKGRKRARPARTAVAASETSASTPAPTQHAAAPASTPAASGETARSREPSRPPLAVASATEDRADTGVATTSPSAAPGAATPGRFSLGVGVAANTLALDGVASYANLSARLSRVELGVGATWPLNTLGFVRVALLTGRFEIAPMVSASLLAESEMTTSFALAGGLSTAYLFHTGGLSAGLRLEALVSYNPDSARLAVPVLGSTYVRF